MIPNIGGPELLILLVVARSAGSRNPADRSAGDGDARRSSARQILDERYARGEIGREEYERVRRGIEG